MTNETLSTRPLELNRSSDTRNDPDPGWRQFRRQMAGMYRNPLTMFGLFVLTAMFLVAIFAPLLAPEDPAAMRLAMRMQPPGSEHWFGTDEYGRDVLSRLIFGTQISMRVGLIVVVTAGLTGYLVGSMAGYFRGAFDDIIMRVMDIILAFPPLVLAMAIAAVLGPDLQNAMIAIAVVHIPKYTRLARGEAMVIRESLFVLAAQSMGASHLRIILRHIMPNSLASILVIATLDFGLVILIAASLGFIGLGAQPPTPEWGLMVADGRRFLLDAPWISAFPGITIMLVVIAANVFGDGLRDVLDPRLRSR